MRRPDAFVWPGLHEPDADEFADIAQVFDLHELPVEDAIDAFQRSEIERYGDMVFAAPRTTRYVEHQELTEYSEVVETGSVKMFVGEHFMITVRRGADRAHRGTPRPGGEAGSVAPGPWSIAHAIYDRIVDSYVDCANSVVLDLDAPVESVFEHGGHGGIQRIYQMPRAGGVQAGGGAAATPAGRHRGPGGSRRCRRRSAGIPGLNDHLTRTVEQVQPFDELLNSIHQARAGPGDGRAERRRVQDRGVGRYHRGLDRGGGRHLRDELPLHPRAAAALRVPGRMARLPHRLVGAVPVLPAVAAGYRAQPSVLLRPEAIGSIIGSGSPAKPCPWVSYSSHAIRLRRRDAIAPATPATAPAASSPTSMPSRRRPDFDSFFMITFVMARLARRLVTAPRVGAMTASGAIADTLVPHRRAAPKDGDIAHWGIIAPRRMAVRRAISACRDIERHAGPAASPRPPAA